MTISVDQLDEVPEDQVDDDQLESSHSSIIVPLLRQDDSRFLTVKMFGDKGNGALFLSNSDFSPILGLEDRFEESAFQAFRFRTYRFILDFMFRLYSNFVKLESLILSYQLLITVWFWSAINDLGILPVKISSQRRDAGRNSGSSHVDQQSQPPVVTDTAPASNFITNFIHNFIDRNIKQRYNRLISLPTELGNKALSRSLARKTPYDYVTIERAIGDMKIPDSILFILELNPLVMEPPPSLPEPYLDADKKIVVPSKSETQKIISRRAEWTLTQHSHKSSEIMRIATETSRLVSWSAVSGIREVMLYVRDDHGCWDNIPRLQEMIQAQLSSINSQDIYVNISIPDKKETVVDFNEHLDSLKPLPDFHSTRSNTPTPETHHTGTGNSGMVSTAPSSSSSFQITTVSLILLNHTTAYTPLLSFIESTLSDSGTHDPRQNQVINSLDATIHNLRRPELIVHCPRDHNFQSFLDGLPRFYMCGSPLFYNTKTHSIGFSDFFKTMRYYSQNCQR